MTTPPTQAQEAAATAAVEATGYLAGDEAREVARAALSSIHVSEPRGEGRFWLIVHEPGMVPVRKGSWPSTDTKKVLREFIAAYPDAYLHILTIGPDGAPDVDHGPEVLQMLDGRSMGTGRKHNARTLAAHTAALTTVEVKGAPLSQVDGWQAALRNALDNNVPVGTVDARTRDVIICNVIDAFRRLLASSPPTTGAEAVKRGAMLSQDAPSETAPRHNPDAPVVAGNNNSPADVVGQGVVASGEVERSSLARTIIDGWFEGNVSWDDAGEMNRHRAFLTADAILAALSSDEQGEGL